VVRGGGKRWRGEEERGWCAVGWRPNSWMIVANSWMIVANSWMIVANSWMIVATETDQQTALNGHPRGALSDVVSATATRLSLSLRQSSHPDTINAKTMILFPSSQSSSIQLGLLGRTPRCPPTIHRRPAFSSRMGTRSI